jgi:hypothetical protein
VKKIEIIVVTIVQMIMPKNVPTIDGIIVPTIAEINVTSTYINIKSRVREREIFLLNFSELSLETFFSCTAAEFSSGVGPVPRPMVLDGIAVRFSGRAADVYHDLQKIVEILLV